MKLFDMDLDFAPNPRRVLIYLVEKGVWLEREIIDSSDLSHKKPQFLRRNPAGKLPILETGSGRIIRDSGAIVEYIEDLHPEPNLIGETAEKRAQVRAFERMAVDWLWLTAVILRNSHPFFADWGVKPNRAAAAYATPRFDQLAAAMDRLIGDSDFATGDQVTIADCTLCAAFDFAFAFGEIEMPSDLRNIQRWHARFATRPSASASTSNFDELMGRTEQSWKESS